MARTETFLDDMGAVFGFCRERIAGKGEDSCCYRFHEQGGVMAVFDGCGGSGAESYRKLGGHTGAYLGSRAAAAATLRWFEEQGTQPLLDVSALSESVVEMLGICEGFAEQPQSKIRGSIAKTLPTTMAALVFQKTANGVTIATAISAGDSRLYQLDSDGLKQLNDDDVADGDAFTNLYDDPPMTNVVSLGSDFTLNRKSYELPGKCVLLAATDGCFGYLKSPMEFEMLLISTLMSSECIDEWQYKLECAIDEVAGDDQTLLAMAYGFRDYGDLRRSFEPRFSELMQMLSGIGLTEDGFGERSRIWEGYKRSYYALSAYDGRL